MIVEWFLDLVAGLVDWFLGLFGDTPVPEWMAGVGGFISDLVARASGLGAWFPFSLFGVVVSALIGLWLVLWTVKGVRWLWGLTPFSGGS